MFPRQLRSQMSETATYDTSIAQLLPWKSTLLKPTPSKPVCVSWIARSCCLQPPRPTTLTPPTYLPPTTIGPKCYPGSTDSRCPRPTTTSSPNCFPGSTDPRCPKITTPQPPKCFPGSNDPRCPRPTPTTTAPPNCYPGSTDPRCPRITTPAPPKCFPGSNDPRCPRPTPHTTAPPNCYPEVPIQGALNNPAPPNVPRQLRSQMSETATYDTSIAHPRVILVSTYNTATAKLLSWIFRSTLPKPTPSKPVCYPGSPDPSCPQPPRPTTLTPPTYLPPTTTGPNATLAHGL
ncbi:hypothetical protein EVAR_46042_1 [Eumeta japonica]|uniref:Uncharacterized protein n=1 Tax=Eumeta variegata TaxID=151549 RepID=A0A4C1XFQ4_EUMVA|nr:hypothetical protein EVAR_46042_1 [Eumeta japonica]